MERQGEDDMLLAEAAYQRSVDAMTPHQKMARVSAMVRGIREFMAREIRRELGDAVSNERIRWEVVLRIYGHEPIAELIREQIARISARDLASTPD